MLFKEVVKGKNAEADVGVGHSAEGPEIQGQFTFATMQQLRCIISEDHRGVAPSTKVLATPGNGHPAVRCPESLESQSSSSPAAHLTPVPM